MENPKGKLSKDEVLDEKRRNVKNDPQKLAGGKQEYKKLRKAVEKLSLQNVRSRKKTC